ncbi:YjaG family protein [Ferrimonas kyonanensis]|uniref:YjaG family protein n=1 Tax=Ferrimonas kyonanensis TaxID=364763 RepID=UPI00042353F6|nr:YjaG family protein [Ferrimonas kyonanensis]
MSKAPGFFSRIKALSPEGKRLFATALAERMLPNFQLFCAALDNNDHAQLQSSLDLLWESCFSRRLKLSYELQLEKLEAITPEPDDHDMYGVYPAMDAVVAVSTIFIAMQQKIEDDLINVSKLSSSTVTNYIEVVEEPELEGKALDDFIFAHEMMQQEKAIQQQLLEWVESEPNTDDIKEMRRDIRQAATSNIGISLG